MVAEAIKAVMADGAIAEVEVDVEEGGEGAGGEVVVVAAAAAGDLERISSHCYYIDIRSQLAALFFLRSNPACDGRFVFENAGIEKQSDLRVCPFPFATYELGKRNGSKIHRCAL